MQEHQSNSIEQPNMKSRRFVLTSYPKEGHIPSTENFRLQEETLPPLQDGEVLFKSLYLSVDPYMRVLINPNISSFAKYENGFDKIVC